jgi:hypothetical protein
MRAGAESKESELRYRDVFTNDEFRSVLAAWTPAQPRSRAATCDGQAREISLTSTGQLRGGLGLLGGRLGGSSAWCARAGVRVVALALRARAR